MTTTIYLVRHGECKGNSEMTLPTGEDPLTENGKLQASLLGKQLEEENVVFTKVFSSVYPRAVETAKLILAEMGCGKDLDLKLDERLREMELDVYENRPMREMFTDIFTAAREKNVNMLDFEVPGIEKVAELDARISGWLEEMIQNCRQSEKPETILVLTHGINMTRTVFKLRSWSKENERRLTLKSWNLKAATDPIGNTRYHKLTIDAPQNPGENVEIDFVKMHEAAHLATLPKEALGQDMLYIVTNYKEIAEKQCATH